MAQKVLRAPLQLHQRLMLIKKTSRSSFQKSYTTGTTADMDENKNWLPVYRYRRILPCMLLARAKFVQTAASLAYLPYSSYQYSLGAIDSAFFGSTVTIALAAPAILALFSRYLNRLVGVVAMSSDGEWARFGYLTFWGRRKNRLIRVDDLLPLSETTTGRSSHKLVKVCWYEGRGDYLLLPTADCDILDEDRAHRLFGEADFLKNP